MEEFAERGEMRRMQREEERERRRIRDRQRRQSMTQEQRERHLARRRRNYQLRRLRAAGNSNASSSSSLLPHHQGLESSTGEASTSDELLNNLVHLPHFHLLGTQAPQETSDFGTHHINGSSVDLEALAFKPTNIEGRVRLRHIRQLARNLRHPIGDDTQTRIHQVAADMMIAKGDASDNGSTQKSLRLNHMKQLARSLNSRSKEGLLGSEPEWHSAGRG